MPKVLDRQSIFYSISESKMGYAFGSPERVDDSSLSVVLPILRHAVTPRTYTTFPETKDLAVKDSGKIDAMQATNKGQLSVFLRSGTIFSGSTQERASLRSMIVLPGVTVDIKVRCIHASRGISRDAKVGYHGVTPLNFEQSVYTSGFTASDQSKYWDSARSVNMMMAHAVRTDNMSAASEVKQEAPRSRSRMRRMRETSIRSGFAPEWDESIIGTTNFYATMDSSEAATGGDDLSSTYADFSKNFDAILSKVKLVDDQVGLALITDTGCQTIEVFDAHDSWKALHGDAVKRLGPSLGKSDSSGVFEYKPEKAISIVQSVLALPFKENIIFEHKPSNGEPAFSVTGLSADKYTGEVVEFDGKVIHLMLLRLQ